MVAAPRLATYEDLLRLPEELRAEVLMGELVTSASPAPSHSLAQGSLRNFIGGPFSDDDGRGGPGGWWIFLEVEVRLGTHDVVRPDLAGWRRSRLINPWEQRPIDVVPDWACEVISPSHAARDRVAKRHLYLQYRVDSYWIVDPAARTLEALQRDGQRWVEIGSYDDRSVAAIAPFEAIELDLARIFPPPPEQD